MIYHTPAQHNYGEVVPPNQVRFWTEREAIAAGYRIAVNDHYGRGAEQAMEEHARAARRAAHKGAKKALMARKGAGGMELDDQWRHAIHIELER